MLNNNAATTNTPPKPVRQDRTQLGGVLARRGTSRQTIASAMALLALSLGGCSDDPKAANEKNFKVALESYLKVEYPTCVFLFNFPTPEFGYGVLGPLRLRALEKAGLVTSKQEMITPPSFGGKPKPELGPMFSLTEEGKKFYSPSVPSKRGRGEGVGGFCVGKASLATLAQFSEPADFMGHKVSQLSYTFTITDLPAWTRHPAILELSSELKELVQSDGNQIKGQATVALTNNGWVHGDLIR